MRLVLVLGDQLWLGNPALAGFDPAHDRILMIEAPGEAAFVWSHKSRIALFFSAMRHFAATLRRRGLPLDYLAIGTHPHATLEAALADSIARLRPASVVMCEPGEWRLERSLRDTCGQAGVECDMREDTHFMTSRRDFADWARPHARLRMETFYRRMRTTHRVLMEPDGSGPAGGIWNLDSENRASFGKAGPGTPRPRLRFPPDALTRDAIRDVERHFAGHPGSLDHFDWPVTREDALAALGDFIEHHLAAFGRHQDAMWAGEPFLHHALLGAALNLHLLDPREAIAAAEAAHRERSAPLAAAEGFIRQILGWREYMRGVYWLEMPALARANHFGHDVPLPRWYWTGATGMNCMREAIGQTLVHGYAHHIQRLMVTGNFAMIAGVRPKEVADWYLAIYVDAVDWAELPNTAGMALFAHGARFTTKPYAASGAYIDRMSNYCRGCRYDPKRKTGPRACPFTTFYWDFIDRNEAEFAANMRTALMTKNLARLDAAERRAIRAEAAALRARLDEL